MADYVGVIDEREGVWAYTFPIYPAATALAPALRTRLPMRRRPRANGSATGQRRRDVAQSARDGRDSRVRGYRHCRGGEAAVIIPVMIDDGRTVRATLHSTLACCAT